MQGLCEYVYEMCGCSIHGGSVFQTGPSECVLSDVPSWTEDMTLCIKSNFPKAAILVSGSSQSLTGFVVMIKLPPRPSSAQRGSRCLWGRQGRSPSRRHRGEGASGSKAVAPVRWAVRWGGRLMWQWAALAWGGAGWVLVGAGWALTLVGWAWIGWNWSWAGLCVAWWVLYWTCRGCCSRSLLSFQQCGWSSKRKPGKRGGSRGSSQGCLGCSMETAAAVLALLSLGAVIGLELGLFSKAGSPAAGHAGQEPFPEHQQQNQGQDRASYGSHYYHSPEAAVRRILDTVGASGVAAGAAAWIPGPVWSLFGQGVCMAQGIADHLSTAWRGG